MLLQGLTAAKADGKPGCWRGAGLQAQPETLLAGQTGLTVLWCRRSPTATAAYSSFLLDEVLAPSDADPSAGFSLHVADIAVQELLSACEDCPVPAPALQVRLGTSGAWPGSLP